MARKPKYDNNEILDRAVATFWRHGWNQTSIRDLEQELDLKAPSIYRRFGTKGGLGAAAVDHYVDRVVRRRVARLDGVGDPVANLRTFFDRSVTPADDGGPLWGCLLTTAWLEADDPDDRLSAALDRGLTVIEDAIRAEVDRAFDMGALRAGITPDAAAATLTLAMQGLMTLARGGAPPADLRRRARECIDALAR